MLFGLLNVNKPQGLTSRAVVNRVQHLVRPEKVGHAGTLDPLATGVLLVCVGQATRLVEFLQQQSKQYVGTFLLGRRSETDDTEGTIQEFPEAIRPARSVIEAVLPRFTGEIAQRPPAYSAIKVGGRRAYQLARSGVNVELPARPVRVDRIEIVEYDYPHLMLAITCGSGTYIRSLGRDIAESLGTGAVMARLCRTAIGTFRLSDACNLEELDSDSVEHWLEPAARAVEHLPDIVLDDHQQQAIRHGRLVELAEMSREPVVAAFDGEGRLLAILESVGSGRFKPARNFAAATG